MPAFMCLLIGQSNEVVKVDTIEAHDAAEAMSGVEQGLRFIGPYVAIEIWLNGRLELRLTLNKSGRDSIAAKPFELER
jgi:hypothetical protein